MALAKDTQWLVVEEYEDRAPATPTRARGRDSPGAGSAGATGCRGHCWLAGPRAAGTHCPWRTPLPASGVLSTRATGASIWASCSKGEASWPGEDTVSPEVALTPTGEAPPWGHGTVEVGLVRDPQALAQRAGPQGPDPTCHPEPILVEACALRCTQHRVLLGVPLGSQP